jgi:anti-sigma factor RsiW
MKENLTCEECERELIALIDGTVTPSVARVIERHAASCASCGESLQVYRRQTLRLRRMEVLHAPASLEDRVLTQISGARVLATGWQRFGAALGAVGFALTAALVFNLSRIAGALGYPDPYVAMVAALKGAISGITSASKWLGNEVAFYVPLARQILAAMEALRSIPRAALVSLKTPEVQVAGAILITLGLALYIMLRPSRRHEGSVGHVCLSL